MHLTQRLFLLLSACAANTYILVSAGPSIGPSSNIGETSTPALPSELSKRADNTYTGYGTFYWQGGNAGACGTVHSDSDLIGAIKDDWYGPTGEVSPLCGKQVSITNTNNGKNVVITVADVCPTCETHDSFDLSYGAFTQIAAESDGQVPISWYFTDGGDEQPAS